MAETELSATSSLTNYINNNSGLTDSNSNASSITKHDEINQQLKDLKKQFKSSIEKLKYQKDDNLSFPLSLKGSLSMPQLPPYPNTTSFIPETKIIKKQRKKPRVLTQSNLLNYQNKPNIFNPSTATSLSTSSSSSSSSSSSVSMNSSHASSPRLGIGINYKNDNKLKINFGEDEENKNRDNQQIEINQKLDLLINIIHSQQEILEKLLLTKNDKKKKAKKIVKFDKCIQTEKLPHIVSTQQNSKQTSFIYPPIPNNQNNEHDKNISMPYDMLLKLINAATNKLQQPQNQINIPPPPLPQMQNIPTIPQQSQWIYQPNNNKNSNTQHIGNAMMSPKSTLYFSD